MLLLRSEAQARKRVVYFLTVFTITGFASMYLHISTDNIIDTVMHVCFYPFTDLLLGYTFAIFESIKIDRKDWMIRTTAERDHLDAFPMVLYTVQVSGLDTNTVVTRNMIVQLLLSHAPLSPHPPPPPPHTQSITVPAQGFLNALVYGWTREDFVHTIMHRRDTSASRFSDEGSAINSGSYRSSILASRALSVNKGFSNSRSYRSLNSTSGKFK